MKKKVWIFTIVILLAVLITPIPTGILRDGGTRTYTALTYKIVNWQRLLDNGSRYECLRIYWAPNSFRSLEELWQMEADLLSTEESDSQQEPAAACKPVIYLYPQTETNVTVKLALNGKLTCTYPAYSEQWRVTASADGTLTDAKGQTYNYLYWEGEISAGWDMTKGFCVKGKETAAFLEWALEELGLNRREANEFIVYWLPLMEGNPYNIVTFQTEAYTDAAQLKIDPAPDTLIRVFMTWKSADTCVSLPAQELTAPTRSGFTVIEWGGAEMTS